MFPGFLFFLVFLGSLWSGMRRAEGGSGWLSTTAFGAGLMSVTINLGGAATLVAARHKAGGLDPQLARLLKDLEEASFILTLLPLAVLLGAFAIVAIRASGGLPGWLGWIAAVISAAFLFGGLAESADLGGDWLLIPMLVGAYPFWVIATSVVLMRSSGESRPVERGSPTGGAAPAR